jgi:hypothetical protein
MLPKFDPGEMPQWIKARAPILCACCGAAMTIVRTQIRSADSTSMHHNVDPHRRNTLIV